MQTYTDLHPVVADPADWHLPGILRARAATYGDKVYLDVPDHGKRWTYAETLDVSERIGSAFLAHGQVGDRVLIMAPNSGELILTWFGAAVAGMAEVPINTGYAGTFLEHQVRTTQPRIAVIDAQFAERFVADGDRSAFASIERFYVLGEEPAVASAIETLAGGGWTAERWGVLLDAEKAPLPDVRAHDLACVLFTSGTTGLSKGVMMPHAHMEFFAQECVSLTRLTDEDVYMCVGPLFHGNAQFLAAYPALLAGARFVLREKFSASGWVRQLRECGATVTNFVGVMMDWTWKQPPSEDDADNQLRCIFAAPTASSIVDGFKQRFGIEAFVESFGLTETSMPFLSPYGVDRPAGAAGLLVEDYFDVRLVDPETDVEVPVGQVGELVVRTKLPWTMCTGYYGMPDKTAEAQRNLWFHTGDALRRDEDGWYYFVDRFKDAIRRRGENISSYEVEQAVLGHAAVVECAAVAAPAATEAGEDEVAVFVVLEQGAEASVDELRGWCDQRLPAFARPEFVSVVDALPMTPSGKVRKIELRDWAVDLAKNAGAVA
ncbi:MAG: AMP-binding protein [Patulibacter sp.]|nr:AMP-binding protein [Patulibacter sp.]